MAETRYWGRGAIRDTKIAIGLQKNSKWCTGRGRVITSFSPSCRGPLRGGRGEQEQGLGDNSIFSGREAKWAGYDVPKDFPWSDGMNRVVWSRHRGWDESGGRIMVLVGGKVGLGTYRKVFLGFPASSGTRSISG